MGTFTRPNLNDFVDFDFSFSQNPVSGDVLKKKNVESIKQSIKNLINTSHFEKPFHPEIGSNVRKMMFENLNPQTMKMIERFALDTIQNFEPRAQVVSIIANTTDQNDVKLTILFQPVNINIDVSFDVLIERSR